MDDKDTSENRSYSFVQSAIKHRTQNEDTTLYKQLFSPNRLPFNDECAEVAEVSISIASLSADLLSFFFLDYNLNLIALILNKLLKLLRLKRILNIKDLKIKAILYFLSFCIFFGYVAYKCYYFINLNLAKSLIDIKDFSFTIDVDNSIAESSELDEYFKLN